MKSRSGIPPPPSTLGGSRSRFGGPSNPPQTSRGKLRSVLTPRGNRRRSAATRQHITVTRISANRAKCADGGGGAGAFVRSCAAVAPIECTDGCGRGTQTDGNAYMFRHGPGKRQREGKDVGRKTQNSRRITATTGGTSRDATEAGLMVQ